MILNLIFNRRIKRHVLEPYVTLITGDRGAGKSTIMALVSQQAIKEGLTVYSQYPYKGTYKIPMEERLINGVKRYEVSKEWLYKTDLTDSVLLLDEVKTIWPARAYNKWTEQDEEFFNYVRKYNTRVFLATQAYDCVDLNVRRASDETMFITKGLFNFSHIECSTTTIAKVADKNTEVMGRAFKKGLRAVNWQIVEMPTGHYLFWRKPYYKDFFTNFTYCKKKAPVKHSWNDEFSEFTSD